MIRRKRGENNISQRFIETTVRVYDPPYSGGEWGGVCQNTVLFEMGWGESLPPTTPRHSGGESGGVLVALGGSHQNADSPTKMLTPRHSGGESWGIFGDSPPL